MKKKRMREMKLTTKKAISEINGSKRGNGIVDDAPGMDQEVGMDQGTGIREDGPVDIRKVRIGDPEIGRPATKGGPQPTRQPLIGRMSLATAEV